MVPYSDFMSLSKTYGMSEITRHNLYNSSEVTGAQATWILKWTGIAGYSRGRHSALSLKDMTMTGLVSLKTKQNKVIRLSSSSWFVSYLSTLFWQHNMRISYCHYL